MTTLGLFRHSGFVLYGTFFFKHYYYRVSRTCHYCALVMIVYSWTGLLINYCNSALSISFNWGPSVGSRERELWPSVILRRLLTSQSIAFLWNFETSLPRKLRHRWFDHLTDCLHNARSRVGTALFLVLASKWLFLGLNGIKPVQGWLINT